MVRPHALRHRGDVANDSAGGPGHAVISSFSGAMIVAGGSGITYALSTVEDLLESRAAGAGRTRVVELVWSVQNPCRHNLHPCRLYEYSPAVRMVPQHLCSPWSPCSAASLSVRVRLG